MVNKKEEPDRLDLAAREARECGLSYGKYMQIKDCPEKVAAAKAKHAPRLKWTAEMLKLNQAARQDGSVKTVRTEKYPMGTGERALKLFELWKQGNSDRTIGQKLGVHYQSVYRWRQAMGLPGNRGTESKKQWELTRLSNGAYYAECAGGN